MISELFINVRSVIWNFYTDSSPLPPTILPAWGFGKTRFCDLRGSVAGRLSNPVFIANPLCRPATLPCVPMSLVIPNRKAQGMGRKKAVRDLPMCHGKWFFSGSVKRRENLSQSRTSSFFNKFLHNKTQPFYVKIVYHNN